MWLIKVRKSSGSDQDGFSSLKQTVAPSCIDTDTASVIDAAVLAAVIEGRVAKAMHDQEVIAPGPEDRQLFDHELVSWYAQYRTDYEQFVYCELRYAACWDNQVVTNKICSDDNYKDDSVFTRMMANRQNKIMMIVN